MSWSRELLRLFARRCVGRTDDYAFQLDDGRYRRMFAPLTYELLCAHLAGSLTIGTYVITERGFCRFAIFDADDTQGLFQLARLQETLGTLGLPSYLEGTRRGIHLRLFLQAPCLPGVLRDALLPYCPARVELYPKQDTASRQHPGSLMRLPLGVHRLTGRRYPFVEYRQDRFVPYASTVTETLSWLATVELISTEVLARLVSHDHTGDKHQHTYPSKNRQPLISEALQGTIREWCAKQDPFALISRYVELDSRGMGCCPLGWHHVDGKDSHPSLKVYTPVIPGGCCWYCHAWGRGGSVFDFLRFYHGLDARELWHRILSGEQF